MLLCCILLLPLVQAESNQGLFWSVSENQIIPYNVHISKTTDSTTIHESFQINVVIVSLQEIPIDVSNMATLYNLGRILALYANGSEHALEFYSMFVIDQPFILPTGNWTLTNELFANYFEGPIGGQMHTEESSLWGYSYANTGWPYYNDSVDVRYSRNDGVLHRLVYGMDLRESFDSVITIERANPFTSLIIVIGIVGLIAIVSIIVIIKRRQ